MPLATGSSLGPYEILSAIGSGGMGEVYRARDTRLQRDVAIKVLPAAFAADPDRQARFEREAQAVATMSHPNILAIFEFGTHGGQTYIVSELLEGETLRERLANLPGTGGLSVRKAIDFGVQIARGLAAAHDKGLVHRDLKPENIFLLRDGQVKILDFGLARQVASSLDAAETLAAVTDPGTVLGTVGYMAPEQVRALAVDSRTDLFAFGAVFYEMLSGQRAFKGDTAADTMTAILREDPPDLAGSRSDLSPGLDRIVRHCLEKNPTERFQTARDVAFALEALSGSGTQSSAALPPPVVVPRARLRTLWWSAAVVAAAGLGATAHRLFTPGAPDVRYEVKTFDREAITNARFMPDGKTIVFSTARDGTRPSLFALAADSAAPQPMGGPGTHLLSVSSKGELALLTDAQFIGHRLFRGVLSRMTLGGAPRQWMEGVREADWSPDGTSLAIIRDDGKGTDRLEYPIGTMLHEIRGYLSDVRVSHDSRRVAFVEHRYRYDDRGSVKIIDGTRQILASTDDFKGVEGVAWAADDERVIFAAASWEASGGINYNPYSLHAGGGRPAAPALPTMTDVFVYDVNSAGQWLLARRSASMSVVVKKPGENLERDLSWLDLSHPTALSSDGDLVVFTDENVNAGRSYAVMIRKADGSAPVRLGEGHSAVRGLSPDRKWVAAEVRTTNEFVFYPTGAGEPQRVSVRPDQFDFSGWFPDSEHIMLCGSASSEARRCFRQATAGGSMSQLSSTTAVGGSVAPDGSFVIVESQTRARQYPANGGSPRVFESRQPGLSFAGWSSDGEPFFIRGTDILWGSFEHPLTTIGTIVVSDRAGANGFSVPQVVGDARRFGYAYSLSRELSSLLIASNVKMRD